MERLTIKTEKGAALKMADNYESESEVKQDLMKRYLVAVNRLAAYEDTGLEPEEIAALVQAEHDGRLVILEPSAKEGEKKPPCFYNDMGQDLCLGFGRGLEDDEPIDRCKECWYCEANRTLREEAEAALSEKGEDNA